MARVVGAAEREAVGVSVRLHGVAAADGDVLSADALIAAGTRVAKRAERCLDQQVSAFADRDAVRSPVGEADLAQVGAGLDVKLVLERSSLAPEDEVDSGPDVAVSELAVGRKVAVLLGADQVVDLAGRPLACDEPRARARTERREVERDSLLLLGEAEDGLVRREVEGVARALGVVAHALVGLAPVWNERERELVVRLRSSLLGLRGRVWGGSGWKVRLPAARGREPRSRRKASRRGPRARLRPAQAARRARSKPATLSARTRAEPRETYADPPRYLLVRQAARAGLPLTPSARSRRRTPNRSRASQGVSPAIWRRSRRI